MYPDPDIFNPGRWIDPSYPTYKEPLTRHPNLAGFSQFGFGRRTCQGIPIVEQDLFLAMGGMAWAFDLRRSRNADGTEIPIHWNNYTPLLIAKPAPFQFDAIPRSDEKRRILRQMWETGRGEDDKTDLEDEESIDNDKEQNNPEKPPETADKAVHENDEESHVVDQDKESSAQSTADDPRNEMSDQTPTATVCLQDDEVKEAGERAKEDDIVSEEDSDATSSCAGTGSGSSDGVNEPKEEIPTITTTVATTTAVSTSSSSSAPPSSSPSPSSSSSSSIKWNTSVRTRPSIDSLPGVNLVARSSRNSFRDGKMAARASLESLRDSFQKMDKGQILELNMAA